MSNSIHPGYLYIGDDPHERVVTGGELLLSRLPWLDVMWCAFEAVRLMNGSAAYRPSMEAIKAWLESRPQPPMDLATREMWASAIVQPMERQLVGAPPVQVAVLALLRAVLAAEEAALASQTASGSRIALGDLQRARASATAAVRIAIESEKQRGNGAFPEQWWRACGGKIPRFPSEAPAENMEEPESEPQLTTGARSRTEKASPHEQQQFDDEWARVVGLIRRAT